MRPATIISILRESHLPFSKNDYNSNRPHMSLCTENFIRIDYVIQSPKVSGDFVAFALLGFGLCVPKT